MLASDPPLLHCVCSIGSFRALERLAGGLLSAPDVSIVDTCDPCMYIEQQSNDTSFAACVICHTFISIVPAKLMRSAVTKNYYAFAKLTKKIYGTMIMSNEVIASEIEVNVL